MELANDRTNEEKLHLFKKVGSNLQIKDRTVLFEPRGAWKTLLDSKIEKLMSAYLESALSLEEYREAKNKLVNQNQLLKEKLSAFEQKANNRFELTEKFLKYNMELANDRTNEENTHLFKKVGSNFQIKDRTVLFEPRGAWKILSDSEFFGGNAEQTALRADHIFGGNLNSEFWRRVRDSKLTASVHLCDFLTAKPLEHIAKVFEFLTRSAQALRYPLAKHTSLRSSFCGG